MRLRYVFSIVAAVLVVGGGWTACPAMAGAEEDYQAAADAKRIHDVHRIAALIEAYRQAAGHYPFRERFENIPPGHKAAPLAATITNLQLPEKYRWPPPGSSGRIMPSAEFEAELRAVLGPDIEIPCDPQKIEVYAPNFYQFLTDGQDWFVSANLYSPTGHTLRLAAHYHKYQVGSVDVPRQKIRRFADIPAAELKTARIAGERAASNLPN